MKKLSDFTDDEALDLFAELIEPVANIFGDKKISKNFRKNNLIEVVKLAVKGYKKDLIHIMALLEGVPVEEYHCNVVSLPKTFLMVLNDPVFKDFFSTQGEKDTEKPFGSATETTEENQSTSSDM